MKIQQIQTNSKLTFYFRYEKDFAKTIKKTSNISITERRKSKVAQRSFINIVLIGEPNTGKSSFAIKYVDCKFEPYYVVTLGTEYFSKKARYRESEYLLNFIVTSGDPQFQEDYTSSYQNVDFFLMFYDITNKKSFEKSKQKFLEIKKYLFRYTDKTNNIFFVGNKSDLKNREVSQADVDAFCKKYHIDSFEISVKTSSNFSKVINKCLGTFDDMARNVDLDLDL